MIAFIAIGRNEGDRLKRCLTALRAESDRIVYVDSGSSDGSVDAAASLGCDVVVLAPDAPFTAARVRNAGSAKRSNAAVRTAASPAAAGAMNSNRSRRSVSRMRLR